MEEDRKRWNARYGTESFFHGPGPARVLAENLDLILRLAPGRRALDVACGEGRNAIFLARHGFAVTAVDISDRGIDKGREAAAAAAVRVDFRQLDLDSDHPGGTYDLIVNINFLLRGGIPRLAGCLSPGGLMLFSSILNAPGTEWRNPAHLLAPGELVAIFSSLPGEILRSNELPDEPLPTATVLFRRAGGDVSAEKM
jgi:2-polyprenyl-3-methyl-5-hydroxy-6-metoxy-1,4-benzoquinol methylase